MAEVGDGELTANKAVVLRKLAWKVALSWILGCLANHVLFMMTYACTTDFNRILEFQLITLCRYLFLACGRWTRNNKAIYSVLK